MENYQEGDVVTLRIDSENFVAAKIVEVEPLTLHDLVHLKIYDKILDGLPGGYNAAGEYVERLHDIPADLGSSALAIDTLAMTSSAFDESEPQALLFEEVTDADRSGYAVWVAQRRDSAERRGMIRYEVDDDEEWDEDDEEVLDEEVDQSEDGDVEEEFETVEVIIRPWHSRVYDIPFSSILREHRALLTSDELELKDVGTYLREKVETGKKEIDRLVASLVDDGDYAAGQELLEYGDDVLPGLAARLDVNAELQSIEDICQILADLGSDSSYDRLGAFVEETVDRLSESDIARAAARSFLYSVMLTGGSSPALKERLSLLERMDHPELKEDLESALQAIAQGGENIEIEEEGPKSSDPFGSAL